MKEIAAFGGNVDELGEHVDLDVVEVLEGVAEKVDALVDRERRLLVRGVAHHPDDDTVEDRRRAADHVHVPERHRVVGAGVDRRDQYIRSGAGKAGASALWSPPSSLRLMLEQGKA